MPWEMATPFAVSTRRRRPQPRGFDASWDSTSRNRRAPKDPVNALLSFGYALLTKDCTVALLAEGFDPWWGLYH